MAKKITLSNLATIDRPKSMLKPSDSVLTVGLVKRFENKEYISNTIREHSDKIYLADSMVVFFTSGAVAKAPGYLERYRSGMDYYRPNGEPSKLENIAGKDVYLRVDVTDGLNFYRFTTINPSGTIRVEGFVQFDSKDRDKAYNLIVELIRGLKFSKTPLIAQSSSN